MGGAVRGQRTRQVVFNLRIGRGILLTELHANTRRAIALGSPGRDPHNLAGDGNLLRLIHQGQQHEYLVTYIVSLVGRDKEPTIVQERHISGVQHRLILYRK